MILRKKKKKKKIKIALPPPTSLNKYREKIFSKNTCNRKMQIYRHTDLLTSIINFSLLIVAISQKIKPRNLG